MRARKTTLRAMLEAGTPTRQEEIDAIYCAAGKLTKFTVFEETR